MLQTQEKSAQSNSLKGEIRQRKTSQQNQLNEDIKPFKSYRRRGNEKQSSKNDQLFDENKNIGIKRQGKLLRQYLVDTVLEDDSSQRAKNLRFKYDLEKNQNQNQLAENTNLVNQNVNYHQNYNFNKKTLTSIRKNSHTLQQPYSIGNSTQRRQVQSIIFDSKVVKFEPFDETFLKGATQSEDSGHDKELINFKQKVTKVNNQIEASLNNLQNLLKEAKRKKVAESQIIQQNKMSIRLKQLQNQQREERIKLQKMNKMIETPPVQIKYTQLINFELSKPNLNMDVNSTTQIKSKEGNVQDSQIQLAGDFNSKVVNFSPQYTSFINRLANQIQIDMQFTDMISQLTKNQHMAQIKTILVHQIQKYRKGCDIDMSFFQIDPSEVDPLDQAKPKLIKKLSQQQAKSQAMNVFKKYKDIENHFNIKLKHKYSFQIMKSLFQQLAQFNFTKINLNDAETVTVGHLLSYLNMRTNKSFRNRFFFKMLKRLSLKSNSYLSIDNMKLFMIA